MDGDALKKRLRARIEAAQGKREADKLISGVSYLDVFSCEWRRGDIAIFDGFVVGTQPGLKGRETIDGRGQWLVPGFVDAHVHVESSLLTPAHFQKAVLPKGTTTAICDPHELANVLGADGIRYFLDSSEKLGMDLWVMLSSCVPATHMETNGGGVITAAQLATLAPHKRALGLAEMMNMPGVLMGDEAVLDKLVSFAGRPIDGHCPLLRGQGLGAYASAGITSCHESSELEEAREKLTQGISVWIREGSVAKDLHALAPLLTLATSTSVGFCTDDRNPLDISTEGHIDHLIRGAIRLGVKSEVAYRSASWSVARHYGLAQGPSRTGAIAPGYLADLVLLGDAETCAVSQVFKRGKRAEEWVGATAQPGSRVANTVRAQVPETRDLEGPSGNVHVIEVLEGKIITGHRVADSKSRGVARLSVLERYGHGSKPANGYVSGFGDEFHGAIASSVGHDSHNLIVVGDSSRDMQTALKALIGLGGGFCVVQNGQVLESLPLPFGGLMSTHTPEELTTSLQRLKEASRTVKCRLPEPFLQLAFLSLPVIPKLKLTDKGLVDVEKFEIISVGA